LLDVLALGSERAGGAPRAVDRGARAGRGSASRRRNAMKNAIWIALAMCVAVGCGESSTERAEPARDEPEQATAAATEETEAEPAAPSEPTPSEAPEVATVGQPAPDFTLTDQAGTEHRLSQYRGRIVVLEWINPECPYVQRHYGASTMTR